MADRYKILFTGTPGGGKTTAIKSVAGLNLYRSEALTEQGDAPKAAPHAGKAAQAITVGMDYGELILSNGSVLELYGTPGQRRFAFRWRPLVRDALGLVILVDDSRPNPIEDLGIYLENFKSLVDTGVAVIGVGHRGKHRHLPTEAYYQALEKRRLMLPVFEVDVRKPDHVLMLLDVLFGMLEVSEAPRTDVGT
ncbi:MAG TPA: hypothetical protein VMB48_14020 [Steroidobacteraceae bacterium]|nr:hypothetical protein [Steroidobacteraceae bacterium]